MSTVTTSTTDNICTVTLNRPDALNAFSMELMDELCEAFLAAAQDKDIKVLILTGAGRAFSAGADLKASADYKPKHGLDGLLETIINFPKPFIAAVNGLGVGIGCTICGLADMTFMAESARLCCPFSALGLTAEAAVLIPSRG